MAWNLGTAATVDDCVKKAGDTMTGQLNMQAGINFGGGDPATVTDPNDLSRHIMLYDGGAASPFGWSISSGTLNHVVGNSANRHAFRVGAEDVVDIRNDGLRVPGGNLSVAGSITGNYITANNGILANPGGGEVSLNVNGGYIIGVVTGGGSTDATSKSYVDTNDGLVRAEVEGLRAEIAALRAEVATLKAGPRAPTPAPRRRV